MAALGFFFVILPAMAIASFTAFAAFRVHQSKVFKGLAYAFLGTGLVCGLTPIGLLVWLAWVA